MNVQRDRAYTPKAVTTAVALCTYNVEHLVEVQNERTRFKE